MGLVVVLPIILIVHVIVVIFVPFLAATIRPPCLASTAGVYVVTTLLFIDPRSSFLLLDGVLCFVIRTLHIHEEVLLVFLFLLTHDTLVFCGLREVWAAF